MTGNDTTRALEIAKAMASSTRLAILAWLADPDVHFVSRREGDRAPEGVSASLIAEKADIAASAATIHLDRLRRAGLIVTERTSSWHYHRLNPEGLRLAHDQLGYALDQHTRP